MVEEWEVLGTWNSTSWWSDQCAGLELGLSSGFQTWCSQYSVALLPNNALPSSLLLSPSCDNFDLNFTDEQQPLEYLKNGDWIRLEHVAYVHFKTVVRCTGVVSVFVFVVVVFDITY